MGHMVDGDAAAAGAERGEVHEAVLAGLLDRVSDGVFSVDRDFVYTYLNEAGARLVGRTPESLVGRCMWEEFPDTVGSVFEARYRQALDTQKVVEFEEELAPVGAVFAIRVFPSPDGLTIAYQDVTAEARARQEAAAAQEQYRLLAEQYRLLVENAADVVLRVGEDDRTVWVSPSLLRVTGWAPETWVGDLRWDLVHPDDDEAVRDAIAALRSGEAASRTVQVRLRHRHGPWMWFAATAQRTGDDPGSEVVVALRDVDAEVRQQEAARWTEALRAAALDAMLDPFALLEPVADETGAITDFRYVEANPATAAYLGRDRDGLPGVRLGEVMAPEAAATLVAAYAGVLDTGEPFVLDGQPLVSQVAGGATRMFDMRATRVEGLVEVVWRDVTDRVEAAERVAAARDQYRLLAENASDVVFRGSNQGVTEWVSESLTRLTGWSPQDLVGKPFRDFAHPGDVPRLAAVQAGVTAGMPGAFDVRVRTRDGGWRWVAISVKPLFDESGTVVGRAGGWRDIQAEVEARQEADAAREQLRLMAENATDVGVRVGPDGTAEWISPAIETCLGWTPEELLGTSLLDLMHPDDAHAVRETRARLLAGEPMETVEDPAAPHRFRGKDGAYRWMSGHGRMLTDEDGRPAGAVYGLTVVDDLVHARAAAEDSEARYRLLADASADVVVRGDAHAGVLTYVSPAVTGLLGYPPEDLVGTRLQALVHPDDVPEVAQAQLALLDGQGRSGEVRARLRRADGSWRWVGSTGSAVLDPDGAVSGFVAAWRDIQDQVESEQALAASEQRYRLLAERGTDIVFRGSPQAVMEWVSPSTRSVLGYDPEEMVGRPIAGLVHPDDVDAIRAASLAANEGDVVTYRARMRHADGSYRWMEVAAEPLRDAAGAIVGQIGSAREVTAQVEAEQALRESEALFRSTLTSASIGVCLIARDGGFLRVNPALCDLLGRDEATLLATSWQDLTHPDDLDVDLGLVQDVLEGRRDSYRLRKRYLRPDGSVVYGDLSVGCVRDPDGSVRHFISQIVDVTEEHDQQQALLAQRARLQATLDSELDPHLTMTAVRDGSGRIVDFTYSEPNAAALDYLGMTADQLQATTLMGMYPSAAAKVMRDMYARTVDTGEPLVADDYAYPNELFAGQERWYDLRGVRLGDAINLTWRDVTDRHLAADALAASEAQYRLLADHSGDVVVAADPAGVLTYVSPAVESVLGWAPDDLVGTRMRALVHPDDVADVAAATQRMRASAEHSGTVRARLRRGDESYRWIASVARDVLDDDGTVVGGVATWRDVQVEVEAEQALAAERARLAAVLDSELEPHVFLEAVRDDGGVIVDFAYRDANDAACAYMNLAREDLEGARVLDLLPGQAGSGMLAMYADAVESGEPLVLDDYAYPHEILASERRYDIRAVRVGDGLSFAWRDVTERYEAAAALAESREQYQRLAENASDMVALADMDAVLRWFSPSVARIGWIPEEVVGRPATELLHPEDWPLLRTVGEATGRGESVTVEWRVRTKDGAYRWFRVRAHPVTDPDGTVTGRVTGWQDIDAERAARVALQESEERFRTAMQSAPTGMAVVGLDRAFVEVNPALCRILGRSAEWLVGRSVVDLLDDPDAEIDRSLRAQVLRGPEAAVTREHQMVRSDGERIWVEHAIGLLRDPDGQPVSFVSQFLDVTESRQARDRLRFLASHDALTELVNRRELMVRIEDLLARKPRTGVNLAVLFIDLDDLKPINDTYGHVAGDAVIATVAQRLRSTVRTDDVAARFGGDEFVVVLTTIGSLDDAIRVADKIQSRVAVPVHTGTVDVPVTLSIGLALVEPGDTPDTALQRADTALYEAKQQGRGRTVVHPPDTAPHR